MGRKISVDVSDALLKIINTMNQKKRFDSMAHIHESSHLLEIIGLKV